MRYHLFIQYYLNNIQTPPPKKKPSPFFLTYISPFIKTLTIMVSIYKSVLIILQRA